MRCTATALAAALAFAGPAFGGSAADLVTEGRGFLASGDTDGAISRFAEAQSMRPNSPEVDLNLGLAHYRKGDHERAAEYFAAAAGKGGGRLASVAKFNLGNARVKQGRFEEALDAYRDALEADEGDDDARFNLQLVQRHLELLKKQEEEREKAAEEFKKRLEELLREIAGIVERQAEVLARTWRSDGDSAGPMPGPEDAARLEELGKAKEPVPDGLGSKIVRALVRSRELDVDPAKETELAAVQGELAGRARKAAETAAMLAAAIRPPPGAKPPPPGPGSQEPAQAPQENPLVGKLELAGGALEVGAKSLEAAKAELEKAGAGAFRRAEPREALGLWKFVQALGELAQPPTQGQGSVPEELKEALRRMQELRARQALVVLDLWATFKDARGEVPGPEQQRAFWERIRAGEHPSEDERLPMARLEIASSGGRGGGGQRGAAPELAERQSGLADAARSLAVELEAMAAKSGGNSPVAGFQAELVRMLRSAAEAMDGAAESLGTVPPGAPEAERAAVAAFVRLTRAPTEMDALMAELGDILARQMKLVMDTWRSDATSRGAEPTEEELEAAGDEIERAFKGEGALAPELEAKLGRAMVAAVEQAARGKSGGEVGAVLTNEEAATLEADLAGRAEGLAGDMASLAASGRQGEANPAAPVLDAAAEDITYAADRMKAASASLPTSFVQAEPDEVRAVAALMRAMSKFAQGAAGSAGEEGEQQQEEKREGEEKEKQEGQEERADEAKQRGEEKPEEGEKEEDEERESVSKQQAERLLDEAAQEERDVRRDVRKRRGSGAVEVRRDW